MSEEKTVATLPSIEESAQKLAQRVKLAFVDLMTDEQMKDMVQVALKKFTDPIHDSYSSKILPSELDTLIKTEITNYIQPKIVQVIKDRTWEIVVNDEQLIEFVAEAAPKVQETLIVNTIKQTLQEINQRAGGY